MAYWINQAGNKNRPNWRQFYCDADSDISNLPKSKSDGEKPRYNRGKHIKSWYTCRHCGCTVNIEHNYCPNCGYKLLWDGIRCLTDTKED